MKDTTRAALATQFATGSRGVQVASRRLNDKYHSVHVVWRCSAPGCEVGAHSVGLIVSEEEELESAVLAALAMDILLGGEG